MKKAHLGAAFVAIALFAWVLAHVRLSTFVEQLKAMRMALPIVMAFSLMRLLLQSIAWSASLKGEQVSVGIPKLAGVRLAGQSMGYLTVLGPVISEPLKIKLLGTSTEPTVSDLHPFRDDVHKNFAQWMAQQESNGRKFTAEQRQWLEAIRDHVAASLTIESDDFEYEPFVQRGGLGKAYQVFGKDLDPILKELNEVLVQ
jgi:EcoEI R protein